MLKRKIKRFLDKNTGDSNPKLPQKLGGIKYVSFDIFDTLIVRDVKAPTDVFRLMEEQLGIIGFYEKRIKAEQDSRSNSDSGEVNIYDIYSCFEGISKEDIQRFTELELETELKVCHPNLDIVDFYAKCKKEFKIILTSDMYLCKDMVKQLLDSCGIDGYERIYVSCDAGKSKWTGELYDYILSDLGIKSNELIHVGNDSFSDSICARKCGIRAIKYKPYTVHLINGKAQKRHKEYNDDLQFLSLFRFINNTTKRDINNEEFYYRFGYENLGILLLGFCKWLYKTMREDGIEQVLFVARDGFIIKEVYDAMGLSEIIPSYYFEMSRRSVRVPSSYSQDLSFDEMYSLLPLPSRTNIDQIFDAWGIEVEPYLDKLSDLGINREEVFWTKKLQTDDRIKKLYCELKPFIIQNAIEEQETMIEYIDQFHFEKKTAFVDIGWGGTIQKELLKTLIKYNRESHIYGYYIALDERTHKNVQNIDLFAKGYIWDNYNYSFSEPFEEKLFSGLYETFFLEHSGSVKKYVRTSDGVVAKRYPYEYMLPGKILDEPAFVTQIQKGALDFVLASADSVISFMETIKPEFSFFFLRNCLVRPSREIVQRFGESRFFNSGDFSYLAHPKMNLFLYCFHPKACIRDFYESQWKIGFLKALFKADINYVNLWKIMGKTADKY